MITWFLLGVAAGFPVWFSAGWMVRRDEYRQLARQRGRACVCGCPGPTPVPTPATVTAHAARVGVPAAVRGGARR